MQSTVRIAPFFRMEVFSKTNRLLQTCTSVCKYSKIEFPLPPKKPLTAFLLFCKEHRQNISKDKGLSAPEQTRLLAQKWNSLNPTSKKDYEESSRVQTIIYGQKHKQYYESLTDEQREELSRMKAEKRESRRLNRYKKALRDSDMPKLPISAYALYLQSQAKEKKDIASISEFSKQVAAKWREMSETERKPYIEQSKNSKELYAAQMKIWREKLIERGDLDLLKAYDESKQRGKKALSSETQPSKE